MEERNHSATNDSAAKANNADCDEITPYKDFDYEHSMGQLLAQHPTALSAACAASLVLGLPLSLNMLWHLRVATNASGRGVLRLLQLHCRLNLLCTLSLTAQLGAVLK